MCGEKSVGVLQEMREQGPVKHVSQLTVGDFERHPVWTWHENDSDSALVSPVEIADPLKENDYEALFIRCKFILNDGTEIEGNVSVSLHTYSAYSIELFKGGRRISFAGSPVDTLEQLADGLGKSIDQITPLKYEASFRFENGTPIAGEVDLRDWMID
jgi:hypothetical protein